MRVHLFLPIMENYSHGHFMPVDTVLNAGRCTDTTRRTADKSKLNISSSSERGILLPICLALSTSHSKKSDAKTVNLCLWSIWPPPHQLKAFFLHCRASLFNSYFVFTTIHIRMNHVNNLFQILIMFRYVSYIV